MLIIYHIEADILQMAVISFSCMETDFFIQIPLKFVTKSPIDNKPALVQMVAWYQQATSTIWTNDDLFVDKDTSVTRWDVFRLSL